jgi:hypothetical protein
MMRYHFLDFERAVLMSLGIVIHAADIFRPDFAWRVKNPEQHIYFSYLADFIHSFRMQSFYLIAGFFSAMLLTRYSPKDFLKNRLVRLGIPTLFCGLTFNSLMHLISWGNFHNPETAFDANYWLGGNWLAHLWFLSHLMLYVYILYIMVTVFPNLARISKICCSNYLLLLVFFVVSKMLFSRIGWRFPESPFGEKWIIFDGNLFFTYIPFFALAGR